MADTSETRDQTGPLRKLTRNHQIVFSVVNAMGKGEHASAGEIYTSAKRLKSGIGYSTVYRALERLRASGLVSEVRVPGSSSALYEAVRESHAHFRCERCGLIDDIDYELPRAEAEQVARQAGVAVTTVTLTFSGLCSACRTSALADPAVEVRDAGHASGGPRRP